jgi:hypothetical protein
MRLGLLLRIQPTPFLWRMQYFLQKLPRVPQRRRLQTLSQVRLRLRPKRAAELRNSAATQRLTVDTMTCFPAFGLSWLISALRFDCRHCDMPRAQSEIPLQVNRLEWVHFGAMSSTHYGAKPAARSGIRICATACQREVEGSSPSSSLSESTRRRS